MSDFSPLEGIVVPDVKTKIAASDNTGESKSRIDTIKEYKSLWTYYNENKKDLNSDEISTFDRLLAKAKEWLLARGENVEDVQTTKDSNGQKQVQETDAHGQGQGDEYPKFPVPMMGQRNCRRCGRGNMRMMTGVTESQ